MINTFPLNFTEANPPIPVSQNIGAQLLAQPQVSPTPTSKMIVSKAPGIFNTFRAPAPGNPQQPSSSIVFGGRVQLRLPPIRMIGPALPNSPADGTGTTTGVSATAADPGSGGIAMSGISNLFSSIGTAFNNFALPGTVNSATTTQPQSNILMWIILALVIYFIFIR